MLFSQLNSYQGDVLASPHNERRRKGESNKLYFPLQIQIHTTN